MRIVIPPYTPDGRYQIDSSVAGKLGEGAFGVCYVGYHAPTNTPVAVKISDRVDVAMAEAMVQKRLKHRNVVQLLSTQVHEPDIAYLVMECCTGGELFDVISKCGAFHPIAAFRMLLEIASGLAYCHAKGVYHRDLKPENILLSGTGHVRIADFGLAKVARGTRVQVCHAYTRCGSTYYMAPEVLNIDEGGYDPAAADIWSLGIILYTMLLGKPPWHQAEDSNPEYCFFLKHGFILPMLPKGAVKILMLMLKVDPAQRPTAQEVEFLVKSVMRGWAESPQSVKVERLSGQYEASLLDIKSYCCARTTALLNGVLSPGRLSPGLSPQGSSPSSTHSSFTSGWNHCPPLENCEMDADEYTTSEDSCTRASSPCISCAAAEQDQDLADGRGERYKNHGAESLELASCHACRAIPAKTLAATDPSLSPHSRAVQGRPPCPPRKPSSLVPPSPSSPQSPSPSPRSPCPSPRVPPSPSAKDVSLILPPPSLRASPKAIPRSTPPPPLKCPLSTSPKFSPRGKSPAPDAFLTNLCPLSPAPRPSSATGEGAAVEAHSPYSIQNAAEPPPHLRMRGPFRSSGLDGRLMFLRPLEEVREPYNSRDWERSSCGPRRSSGEYKAAFGSDWEKSPRTPRPSASDGRPVRLKPLWEELPVGRQEGSDEHCEVVVVDKAVQGVGFMAINSATEEMGESGAYDCMTGRGGGCLQVRNQSKEELVQRTWPPNVARSLRQTSGSGSGTSATGLKDGGDQSNDLGGSGSKQRWMALGGCSERYRTSCAAPGYPGLARAEGRETMELEKKFLYEYEDVKFLYEDVMMEEFQNFLKLVPSRNGQPELEHASSSCQIAGPLQGIRLIQSLRHSEQGSLTIMDRGGCGVNQEMWRCARECQEEEAGHMRGTACRCKQMV